MNPNARIDTRRSLKFKTTRPPENRLTPCGLSFKQLLITLSN